MRGLSRVLAATAFAGVLLAALAASAHAVVSGCYPWEWNLCSAGPEIPLQSNSQEDQTSGPFDIGPYPQALKLKLAVDSFVPGGFHGTRLFVERYGTDDAVAALELLCPTSFECPTPETLVDVAPGRYEVHLVPKINSGFVGGTVTGRVLYDREVDARDDRCAFGPGDSQVYLAPGYNNFGNLEFGGDEDWQTVAAPLAKKMLLALNLAGNAEAEGKNYDLALWKPDCSARLALSQKDDAGTGSADRVLVDVAAGAAYRSQVLGRTMADFEATGSADYQQATWFGNVNGAFRLYHAFCSYDATRTPEAPGGYLKLWGRVNNWKSDFRDLTIYTVALPTGQKLERVNFWRQADNLPVTLAVDDPSVKGVGATVSIPNLLLCHAGYSSALCRLDKGDSFSIELVVGLPYEPQHKECLLDMDLYGNPVLEFEEATAAASAGDLEGESLRFNLPAGTGSPQIYLPLVAQ